MATSPGLLTPAELLKQARAIAAQEIAAARAPIDAKAAEAARANLARGQAIQGFSGALADVLGGIQPIVKGAYDDASTRTATFAKGFSDGLRMKTQGSADQTNQFLTDVVGAPAGQMISPTVATGAGDVAYGLGGYIPATELTREGAAYEAAAAQLPGYARLRGQQDFTSNLFAGSDVAKQFADQIATLAAGRPKLVNDLYQQLQQLQTQTRAADVNQAIAISQLTGEVTPQAAALLGIPSGTKTAAAKAAAVKAAAAKASAAAADAKPDAGLSRARGYLVDATGSAILGTDGNLQLLPGYTISKRGRVVKAGQPKPVSASDRRRLSGLAEDLRYGIAPKKMFNSQTQTWMDVPGTGTPNSSYNEAYQQLIDNGAPPKLARRLVNRLYKPGEFGRPKSKAQKKMDAAVASGLGIPTPPLDALAGLTGGR